ncbi:MAG: hypothetical protein AAGF82_00390 [Pseudomonadota bacterium]
MIDIRKTVCTLIVAAIFMFSGYGLHAGTLKPVAAGTLYYENLTPREISVVQQRLRLDEPAATVVTTSLQEDGWSNEPALECPVSIRDGALQKAALPKGEWFEAVGTGVLATTVSMAIFYLGGVRFDWA